MQITNDYNVANIFETSFPNQAHKKTDNNSSISFDSVSISDAALKAYANSKANSVENENNSDSTLYEQFKKQFNSYRGKGIFSEDESLSKSVDDNTNSQQMEEEKVSKNVSELERKIKDLTEKLESIMSSNMPEHEKDMMANQIHKELDELQSQLTAYKQAQKALASVK